MAHTDPEADMVNTNSDKWLQMLTWTELIFFIFRMFPKCKTKWHHDGTKRGKLPASLIYKSNSNKYALLSNMLGDTT